MLPIATSPWLRHGEAEWIRDGSRILALAMAVTQHASEIEDAGREILQSELADLYAPGDPVALSKRGIHYADATQDLRLRYAERLQKMPFEGYVAFANLDQQNYEQTYLRLLDAIIARRLKAAESQFALFTFERNDKVSQEAIKARVQTAHEELRRRKDRHPKMIGVDFASKPHLGVSVPDFLLGMLYSFLRTPATKSGATIARDVLLFERIRDKYHLIYDFETGVEYSRRRAVEPWSSNNLKAG